MSKSANPALKIEQWDIGRIQPYPNNAKVHPPAQLAEIGASIGQFGFVQPVLVDAEGILISGHGRLDAAKARGMTKIPVIRVTHLSEADAKALRLADNVIASHGSYDPNLLESELALLRSMDFDLDPIGLGNIELPDVEEPVTPAPRANRSKTTIFLSVANAQVAKARKVVAAALDKANIPHNL
jgi:ParB-like nuclease domain